MVEGQVVERKLAAIFAADVVGYSHLMQLDEMGTLRSGSGKKVTDRKQAIAIGLSEARRAGGKVPNKKSKSRS